MTIAQQLKVKEFPFEIKDSKGNIIYSEYLSGYWERREYDSNNNQTLFVTSSGFWSKREYGSSNNQIYYANSNGYIEDSRPKQMTELTLEDIASKFNIPLSQLKIKK